MLTHYNIASNIQQVSQVFMLDARDKILGILPFFHSFGFMAALWLPAVNGVGVVYHPNPLDAQVIGELVAQYNVTFLIATPTFLQAYMRRCSPESFGRSAIRSGRRRKTAGSRRARLRRYLRHSPTGRLRLHRMLSRRHREWHATFALLDSARSAHAAARSAIRCPASP